MEYSPNHPLVFRNRAQAGKLLAAVLTKYANRRDAVVLGLPRGGVPVAYEIATALQLPLDVMVVRKLGMPGWEELAMGAIASGGVRVVNDEVMNQVPSAACIQDVENRELAELKRREIAYRGKPGAPDVKGRTVILVDDGIATGASIRAAVMALRQLGATRIVIAAPTAAADSCDALQSCADECVVLSKPVAFHAVGCWYEEFPQVSDAQVRECLASANTPQTTGSG